MEKWKKSVASVLVVPFILIGCADKEAMDQYYQVEAARTQAIIDSIESQTKSNAQGRVLQMQTFSNAATNAAATESPVDDALLAFAWGYQLGQPQNVEIPKLQPIKAPDSSADLVRAWTPIIGMAVPFLWAIPFANNSGSGTTISADNGATVALDSGNAGSYNTAGEYMTTTIDTSGQQGVGNQGLDNCASGECEEEGGGVGIAGGECVLDPDGLACEGCSCSSLEAGDCVCAEPY